MRLTGSLRATASAVAVIAAVLLSIPLLAATSRAAPLPPPSAPVVAHTPGGSPAAAVPHVTPHPTKHACANVTKAGWATCFVIERTDVKAHKGLFAAAATAPAGYGPSDLQSAYNLPSATAGSGQTVAIVDAYDDPNAEADLQVYRAQYGLPACTTANGCFR